MKVGKKMKENKVNFGIKNAHYATFTETNGIVTYGKPIPIPGSVELTLEPKGDMTEFFADDMLYYSAPNNQGYDGTLTIASIPESFAIDCLGEQLDSVDKVLTETQDSKPQPFALLFEFDGDQKATRHVLYHCMASRPTVGGSTKTNSAEPKTNELKFAASARPVDRNVKTKTTAATPEDVYTNWYKDVYVKIA